MRRPATIVSLSLAVLTLAARPAAAAAGGIGNGENFQVLSNGLDVVYAGVGAGGGQVAGVDGLGIWVDGSDLKGTTLTAAGDFGYRLASMRQTACVLGPPVAGLSLDFPALVMVELDGRNAYDPDVFLKPGCTSAGMVGMTSGGVIPYGTPPGASASFLVAVLPSAGGLPSAVTVLLPNHGLAPSANGGTATVLAATSTNLPIASTGFCWTLQFTWSPTALVATEDHDGWWTWLTDSTFGNQYWGLSNDELDVVQSQSVVSDTGFTALTTFFAPVDVEAHFLSAGPVSNDALAPAGSNATGPYYATGGACPDDGDPINGGFDLGRHLGISLSGTVGAINPNTGLGAQDPSGSPMAPLTPTLGFVDWDNKDYGSLFSDFHKREHWVEVDIDIVFKTPPEDQMKVPLYFGCVTMPIAIPANHVGPWPQPETILFLPFYISDVHDQTGDPCWPDPNGFPGGSFGVPPVLGSTVHLPIASATSVCIGLPFGIQYGSSGLLSATGPLTWNPEIAEVSTGRTILVID